MRRVLLPVAYVVAARANRYHLQLPHFRTNLVKSIESKNAFCVFQDSCLITKLDRSII